MRAQQGAKGGIAVSVASGARLGTEASPIRGAGIHAWVTNKIGTDATDSANFGGGDIEVVNDGVIRTAGLNDGNTRARTAPAIWAENTDDVGAGDIKVTNSGTLVSEQHGIFAEHRGTGDITLVNTGEITTWQAGVLARHSGTGGVTVEHRAGRIVGAADSIRRAVGIQVQHWGEANERTGGVRVVSAADIDMPTSVGTNRAGIGVYTPETGLAAGTTVPISVEVTGGTVTVPASERYAAVGIQVTQRAKGGISVSVAAAGHGGGPHRGHGHRGQDPRAGRRPRCGGEPRRGPDRRGRGV